MMDEQKELLDHLELMWLILSFEMLDRCELIKVSEQVSRRNRQLNQNPKPISRPPKAALICCHVPAFVNSPSSR